MPAPRRLAQVDLKKGQPLGFKVEGKVTTAYAGEPKLDLPADGAVTHWELSKPDK